ncbi:MAG: hypothetical protein AAGE18_14230 [Pseudomonadota bacterium]
MTADQALATLQPFLPYPCDHDGRVPVLAICNECGCVEEHDGAAPSSMPDAVAPSALRPQRDIAEVHGSCSVCAF